MSNIFFISDLHLGHKGILNFKNNDGTPLRPFSSVEEMHEELVSRWNSVVKDGDKVYVLGDVAMKDKSLPILERMKGTKRLIRGNHDIYPTKLYAKYFKEIYGVRVFVDDFVLSHVPIHPACITRRWKANVHGHLHGNLIKDSRYFSVCVEQIDYTPIEYSVLRKTVHDRLAKDQELINSLVPMNNEVEM